MLAKTKHPIVFINFLREIAVKSFFLVICLLIPLTSVAKTPRQISVAVDILPEMLPADAQDWTVYIYAAKPGSRLPLAALKTKLGKLPISVVLKQSMFLLPTHTLKDFQQVVVSVTASENADPHKHSAKDLIGQSRVLSFENTFALDTNVTIDRLDIRQ